jgi:NTE family protein
MSLESVASASREVEGRPSPGHKRVLYVGPSPAQFEALVEAMPAGERGRSVEPGQVASVDAGGQSWTWIPAIGPEACLETLRHQYVNLIVLDLRCSGDSGCFERQKRDILELLDALDTVQNVEERYALDRVLLLVSGFDEEQVDQAIIQIGGRGVSAVLRQPCRVGMTCHPTDPPFARRVLDRARALLEVPRQRRRALCLASGGITGIYFELGALKCLDDCMSGNALNTFDMYFGISAGAVVSSFLAVGYSVDEVMAAMLGIPTRLEPIDMRLFRLSNLDLRELGRRAGLAVRAGWSALGALSRGKLLSLETLLLDYSDVLGPPFRTNSFGDALAAAYGAPGATNDFRRLPSQLFIGATNQDTRGHVLFGSEGRDDVPISRAVEASMALNPAFTSVEIDGRYYEDGAVTRTSNFVEAMRRGAGFVLTVDPFVPYVARERGYSRRRGVLYNADQNIRTMTWTRFANTRDWMLRRFPNVSSYTFVPQNSLRELLSVSPFDHRPALEIWRGAYLSTLQRLQSVGHRMAGDLAAQGVTLDLSRAEAVAARLGHHERPAIGDFFPNGTLAPKELPLANQPGHPRRLALAERSAA